MREINLGENLLSEEFLQEVDIETFKDLIESLGFGKPMTYNQVIAKADEMLEAGLKHEGNASITPYR